MAVPRAEYQCWWNMIDRCTNRGNVLYPLYGGRGILVCNLWHTGFHEFFADMGLRPTPQHSIDRINNDGNYEPSNCRWATKKEQSNNSRPRYSSSGKQRPPKGLALRIWRDARLDTEIALAKINATPGYDIEWTRTNAYRHLGPRKIPTGPKGPRR